MPVQQIPLPTGIATYPGLDKQTKSLTNLYHEDGFLMPRPGVSLTSLTMPNGAMRGSFKTGWSWGTDAHVIGTSLYYTLLATATDGGSNIGGTGRIYAASSTTECLILDTGAGGLYLWDQAGDTITTVTATSNFEASRDVEYINGRAVLVGGSSDLIYYTDVNDFTTVGASSFFDAEEQPDKPLGLINLKNDLYVLGYESIEIFRDTGDATSPFRRVDGSRMDLGYYGGKCRYKDGCLIFGRSKNQTGIYYISGASYQKISTTAVDNILSAYWREEFYPLSQTAADTPDIQYLNYMGRTLIFVYLPNETLMYYNGSWGYATSPGSDTYDQKYPIYLDLSNDSDYAVYVDDNQSFYGEVSGVNDEYGEPIEYEAQWFARSKSNNTFKASNLTLNVDYNHDSASTPISLQTSEDGVNYGPEIYQTIAQTNQVNWNPPGGLGRYHGYMGLKVKAKGTAQFAVDGATLDLT